MSNEMNQRAKFLAFAGNLLDSGKLQGLRSWWDSIVSHVPNIGYYSNGSKSWLTVREQYFDDSIKILEGTSVKITMRVRRHLGATVGSKVYK